MVKKYICAGLCFVMVCSTVAWSVPAALKLTQGRIAISHDGNAYDKDDTYSLAMDWAVMAAFGMQKRLAHVHHSTFLSNNDSLFRKEMVKSAEGWKYFPGFDSSVVFDAWVDIDKTVAHFKAQADMSTVEDKLYFSLAGPMHVPYLCIQATAKEKRRFIHCVSHTSVNERLNSGVVGGMTWANIKSAFTQDGLVCEKISDNSPILGGEGHEKWSFLDTGMTVKAGIPLEAWQWVYSRDWKGNGDCSDNRAIWYILTGKTETTYAEYKERFQNPVEGCGVTWAMVNIPSSSAPAALKLTQGRIAISHDGNAYDKDDTYSLAMDWAVMAAFGMQKRLAHVHHSTFLSSNDSLFRKEMVKSAEGWKYFPGFDSSVVFDAWVDIDKTVAHFKAQADMSTAEDKLYFSLAGPMHVPYLCIQATAKEKRRFIHCISHSAANEGTGSGVAGGRTWANIKSAFGPDGLLCEDLPDYSAVLGGMGHDKWSFLDTAMTVKEGIPLEAWKWVYSRDWKGNGDCSDNRVIWYILTGITGTNSAEYMKRFQNPLPMLPPMGQVSIVSPSARATGFSGIPMELSISQKNKVLDVTVNGMKGIGLVAVYNLQSRLVGKGALMNGNAQISLDRGTRGSYVVKVESQGQKVSKQVLLK